MSHFPVIVSPWECFGNRVTAARGESPRPLNNRSPYATGRKTPTENHCPSRLGVHPFPEKYRITETRTFRTFSLETCATCDVPQDSYLRWENEHSMTRVSESHEEATTSMSRRQRRSRRHVSTHSTLNAKKRKKIGCWNVRTLNEVGRTAIY